ncbi:MAG: 5-formyltetrahydrofolate cyclo-ligase [Hyphomicrobiaceae bacterium]|nr:5-formyltetrahydrofolate cyclo-ligase [Hyphomicrobiaceae bacterium]
MDGPAPSEVTAAKKALREEAKARRARLAADERRLAAERIAIAGLDFLGPLAPETIVSGFLAIGEEINPGPLLSRLHGKGFRIALPVMAGKGKPLLFRQWQPGAPLKTVVWGIREPDESAPEIEPDVLVVPLLAYDRTGQRLGYGGGFYDRTIRALRARREIVTVGIAFAGQMVDAVPHLDYDERLDWVLTPEGPIRCTR